MAEEKVPDNLKGYHLEREGGIIGFIKKLVIVIVILLAILYFFRRAWFDIIINYVTNFF